MFFPYLLVTLTHRCYGRDCGVVDPRTDDDCATMNQGLVFVLLRVTPAGKQVAVTVVR